MRRLRDDFVARLRGVDSLVKLPIGIHTEIRDAATPLLGDPKVYPVPQGACGGNDLGTQHGFVQETRIGRYE